MQLTIYWVMLHTPEHITAYYVDCVATQIPDQINMQINIWNKLCDVSYIYVIIFSQKTVTVCNLEIKASSIWK
jgi:hypothetical protein